MAERSINWIHPDHKIKSDSGICYGVRYMGCHDVNTSMKALDFDTRTAVARECIYRVCSAGGLTIGQKRRISNKKVVSLLGKHPTMKHAGTNVNLTISTRHFSIISMDNGDVITDHELSAISFASGGDPDSIDFVAYVAKNNGGRACHVLECRGGLAQDVIQTIGQAFELRYSELLETPRQGSESSGATRYVKYVENSSPNQFPLSAPPYNAPLPPSVASDFIASDTSATAVPQEEWFHGPLERPQAEQLVRKDGDFLVRETTKNPGQFVLSGMRGSMHRHLLLVDPNGVVRTKDRAFANVSHLVNYHYENHLPIISQDSELMLQVPIFR